MTLRAMRSLILVVAVFLGGCRVDALTPVNLADIDKVATAKQSIEATARLLLTFSSGQWCEDLGASLVVVLKSSGLNMAAVSCAKDPESAEWHGELRMPVRIVSDENAGAASGELALLAVKADAGKPGALSIVAHLDGPRLNAARERLVSLAAARDSGDASTLDLTVIILIRNDLAKDAILAVNAMTTETDPQVVLPAGGARAVTLSKAGMEKLLQEQAVEFLSIEYTAN